MNRPFDLSPLTAAEVVAAERKIRRRLDHMTAFTRAAVAEWSGVALEPSRALVHVGALPRIGFERCDRCVAYARVSVRIRATGLRLQFCAHHYGRHASALASVVDAVNDEREALR